jgi:hypothetical protein
MTRATLALIRGDLAGALSLHPLSLAVGPVAAALIVEHASRYLWTGRAFAAPARWKEAMLAALAVLLIAVWILRFFGSWGGPVPI